MRSPPKAYTGPEPVVFVCYAHADAELVHDEIRYLQGRGCRVTYDEGIRPGSTWTDSVAEQIQRCRVFLFFLSTHSVASQHCRRELSFALEEDKEIVAVHLEDARVPPGVRFSLNNRQAILRYQLSADDYREKLAKALNVAPQSGVREALASAARVEPICIGVAERAHVAPPSDHRLSDGVVRYLCWHGSLFRVREVGAQSAYAAPSACDYRVEVGVYGDSQALVTSWQVRAAVSEAVVRANRIVSSPDEFVRKNDRIAEAIAVDALSAITARELHLTAGKPLSELGFCHLMLKADQLHYLGRQENLEREQALVRAVELQPAAGLPHAYLASLLAWRLLNGLESDRTAITRRIVDEARIALRLDGNDPAVLLSVGISYCRMGRYAAGLSLIRRSCRIAPSASAKDQLARSLCLAGKPAEAIALFGEILDSMPEGHPFPFVRLAIAQAQAGRLEEALASAIESTVLFPNDYYGWFVLANLLATFDRLDEAREAIREARTLAPRSSLDSVIAQTIAAYGRTPEQCDALTRGLKRLLLEES